jgi:hypothetical protein
MYALLLLDEGSPITGTIWLFKAVVTIILFVGALRLTWKSRRTSGVNPFGLAIAGLLAAFGVGNWPEQDAYGVYSNESYFVVSFLFTPLMVAGVTYLVYLIFYRKKSKGE